MTTLKELFETRFRHFSLWEKHITPRHPYLVLNDWYTSDEFMHLVIKDYRVQLTYKVTWDPTPEYLGSLNVECDDESIADEHDSLFQSIICDILGMEVED